MDYLITATSEKEYKEIKNALSKFDNFYKIESEGQLSAKNLIDDIIQIFPESKQGVIKEVVLINKNLEGYLLKGTPKFSLILLGNHRYSIEYKNPDFEKK